MNSTPRDWDSPEDDSSEQPSFEEIANAVQNMMTGQGDMDPELAARLGLPSDPAVLRQMMSQAQSMVFSASNPETAWDQAREAARTAAAEGSQTVSEKETSSVREAFTLASMWLDEVTELESPAVMPRTYTPRQWVEASFASFREMTEPVAGSVTSAMARSMQDQVPAEMQAALNSAQPMLEGMGQALFASQLGQAVGVLAGEVLSTSDIGVPLIKGSPGLVPNNIAAFSEGLEVDPEQIRIYLALREEAHARLFHRSPWLRAHVFGAVRDFAHGIEIDTERMNEVARQIDPADPSSIQEAMGGGLFQPSTTPAQKEALARLENLLALIEGWVDVVVNKAAHRLPGAAALAETIRRRRVTQGPAEQTFASLVGLQLRPRRLRDAAALFHFIEEAGGSEARENIWTHPDLLPTAQDLDDPAGYQQRQEEIARAGADVDAELAKLLAGGFDSPADGGADGGPEDRPQD